LKHRYVGSLGGFLWSVIHPLVLLVCYSYIGGIVFRFEVGPEFGTDSFAIFLFCGILPWLLFQDTIIRNCSAITDNAQLITKTVIPAEILPVAITISNLVHHMVSLGILLGVLVFFHNVPLSVLWIFLYMPILLMLAQGLGWIVAGLHVFLRDTIQAIQVAMVPLFWFTPIFYSADLLPQPFRSLLNFNPLTLIVTGYRNSLLDLPQPPATHVAVVLGGSIAVFILGALLFRYAKPAFPEVL
jgi:ABC-type polysaccharide/polyol phosphate export permease